jgi:hypothetical protein
VNGERRLAFRTRWTIAIRVSDLDTDRRAFAWGLATFMSLDGWTNVSQQRLAHAVGRKDKRTAAAALDAIEEAKLLTVLQRSRSRRGTQYQAVIPSDLEEAVEAELNGASQSAPFIDPGTGHPSKHRSERGRQRTAHPTGRNGASARARNGASRDAHERTEHSEHARSQLAGGEHPLAGEDLRCEACGDHFRAGERIECETGLPPEGCAALRQGEQSGGP